MVMEDAGVGVGAMLGGGAVRMKWSPEEKKR